MLSKISVKKPYTVLVGVVLILVLGYVSFTKMKTDLLPDMNLPYAIVYTTYIGASPEQVEQVVTRPIEQSMATISNVENISSTSSENISMVILEFSQSANMDAITVDMREKLDQLESAWDDTVGNPIIMKLNPNMLPIMVAGLEAGDMTQAEMTNLVNNDILQELESIEGVASVSEVGTIVEQVQIIIREEKLEEVNKKVRKALDKKFEEAKAEIEDAKAELEDGEAALDSGKEALKSATGSAQEQLDNGKTQLLGGQVELANKEKEVLAALAEMEKAEQEMNTQEQQLLEGEKALLALPAQLEVLKAQKAPLDQAMMALSGTNATQIELIKAYVDWLKQQLALLNSGQYDPSAPITPPVMPDDPTQGITDQSLEDTQEETAALLKETEIITQLSGELEEEFEIAAVDEEYTEDLEDAEIFVDDLQAAPETEGDNEQIITSPDLPDIDISGIFDIAQDSAGFAALLSYYQGEYQRWSEILGQLQAIGIDVTLSGVELEQNIYTVKGELSKVNRKLEDGIDTIQDQINKTPEQLAAIEAGKLAIAEGRQQLSEGKTQLLGAKQQIEEAKIQMSQGGAGMATAQSMLDGAKIDAVIEMAAGKAQLGSGKAQIEAALDQIEDQKEAAYDQADVREIVSSTLVKGILAGQNFMMPAGYVTEDGDDILVRVGNKLIDTKEMGNLVILDLHMDDLDPILLSDVADVIVTDDSDEVYASINGNTGVVFSMQKQSGYSTGEVSDNIKKKFKKLEETRDNVHFISMMDQGVYIDLVINSVLENMMSGAVLAILVLLIFLGSFRPTLVIACSIPISIVSAIVLMYFSNISLNIISLSGLALGVGMLVDNSIVVIENIYRLRGEEGYSVRKAAVEGANQVAGAIAASTLTTICVFAPIVFTDGITKQLFVDMGLTIGYSLVASLVVALTLVPAMAAGLLRKPLKKQSRFFTGIQNIYAGMLRVALKLKILVLLLAVGLLVLSAKMSISKGTEFIGEMESTQVSVTLTPPEESTLTEAKEISNEVIRRILTIQDVIDVGAMQGGSGVMSMMGGRSRGSGNISMYVLLSEEKTISNDELVKEILDKTKDIDCELNIQTSSMDMSALGGSGISIQIKGRDLDKLKELSSEVADILRTVEGTKDVSDGIEEKQVEFRLVVDKNKAMGYQLTVAQIYQMLAGRLADATTATVLTTDIKDFDVLVISDSDETLTRKKIEELTIEGTDSEQKKVDVSLKELVEFVDTEGFTSIQRTSQNRYVTASAAIADGYNVGLVSNEVQKKLDGFNVPEGYSITMAGEDETINDAMEQVMLMMVLAIIFMYLIMVAQFQSLLSPFIILFTIPLAFTGGFMGLYIADKPVSVIGMIGFVMLAGIIVNNGIVLVDYINQLRREGMDKKTAIVESGRTRLRPVIMTALTTILGLCTMAAGMGMGADMVQPMAIVTIGGLIYGTLMTLFVIPCVYDIFQRNKDMTDKDEF